MIHHWQCTRQTEANWASMRIWFSPKFDRRSAKHLGARLELNVNLETNGSDVVHCWRNIRSSVEALKR
jgi:hypothetical protein